MAIFVLVHGPWHGGWCWRKLTPLLQAAGHQVYTPTLTGLGERSHLLQRDVGLDTHIRDIIQVLEYEDLERIVLLGHAYGGMVISGVAEVSARRIARLIYLDAFVPEDGQSAFDMIPVARTGFKRMAMTEGKGWLVPPLEPEDLGVTDPEDVAWMKQRLRPTPLATHEQTIRIGDAEAKKLPRSYILCRNFGAFDAVALKVQREGWDYYELKTGHDAMITVPQELAQLLLNIVGAS